MTTIASTRRPRCANSSPGRIQPGDADGATPRRRSTPRSGRSRRSSRCPTTPPTSRRSSLRRASTGCRSRRSAPATTPSRSASLDGVILVRTDGCVASRSTPAPRRPRRRRLRWEDVVPRASELGLAALHGSTPDVSVAGYSLGGGVGWYARKHGLSANSVARDRGRHADGRLRRVDDEHDPELFWALRGGGGSFGIVTAIEIRLYPIDEVYAGVLFFPVERAARGPPARGASGRTTAPDEVTSVGRLLQLPPLPELPRRCAGGTSRRSTPSCIGDRGRGQRAARTAARARPADRHLRDDRAGRDRGAAHGPARAGRRRARRADAGRARRGGDRPLPRRRRPGVGLAAGRRRHPPRRRRAAPAAARPRRARRRSTPST